MGEFRKSLESPTHGEQISDRVLVYNCWCNPHVYNIYPVNPEEYCSDKASVEILEIEIQVKPLHRRIG